MSVTKKSGPVGASIQFSKNEWLTMATAAPSALAQDTGYERADWTDPAPSGDVQGTPLAYLDDPRPLTGVAVHRNGVASVTAVHLTALWLGLRASVACGLPWPESIAVAIAGSQKTHMVGAYVALAVGPLAILPMVAYHAVQLFVDTIIADRWARESR